uniref:Ig-like domain-containing protein n=1 Tax=Erpetoichthys calabaricus TaxID=27687 RepID=A0A8C4SRC3_ERPCA
LLVGPRPLSPILTGSLAFPLTDRLSFCLQVTPQVFLLYSSEPQSSQAKLTCLATGFYPPDVNLTLKRKDETLKTEKLTSPSKWLLDGGTFGARTVSTFDVTVVRGNRELFICEVTHSSLDEPIRKYLLKPGG